MQRAALAQMATSLVRKSRKRVTGECVPYILHSIRILIQYQEFMGTPGYYSWFRRPANDAWQPWEDKYLAVAYTYEHKSCSEISHHFDGSYFQRRPQDCEDRVRELIAFGLMVSRS